MNRAANRRKPAAEWSDDELLGELGDRYDEDHIEEQLEPARMSFAFVRDRAQPRGCEPTCAIVRLASKPDPHR